MQHGPPMMPPSRPPSPLKPKLIDSIQAQDTRYSKVNDRCITAHPGNASFNAFSMTARGIPFGASTNTDLSPCDAAPRASISAFRMKVCIRFSSSANARSSSALSING